MGALNVIDGMSISLHETFGGFAYYSIERGKDEWTHLKLADVGENEVAEFGFIKGHEGLIVDICSAVASKTSTLILVPDYSCESVVISGIPYQLS